MLRHMFNISMLVTVLLVMVVNAEAPKELCFDEDGIDQLIAGIRKNEIRLRKYSGTSVCCKDGIDDVPTSREFERNGEDVDCYKVDNLVDLLGRCVKKTGDFDDDDFDDDDLDTADRTLVLDTVVRTRCTRDDWCCLFPNKGAYTCSKNKCGKFVC